MSASLSWRVSPGASVKRRLTCWRGVGAWTCSANWRWSLIGPPLTLTCTLASPKALPASTGKRSVCRRWSARVRLLLAFWMRRPSGELMSTLKVCVAPDRLCRSRAITALSPTVRKRGVASSATSGAATCTSASALPNCSGVATTAIRRRLPLKSGTGSVTSASPWASRLTGPEKRSTSLTFLGRLVVGLGAASPPNLSLPLRPAIFSMRRPYTSYWSAP